jgi:hypothetical protein
MRRRTGDHVELAHVLANPRARIGMSVLSPKRPTLLSTGVICA